MCVYVHGVWRSEDNFQGVRIKLSSSDLAGSTFTSHAIWPDTFYSSLRLFKLIFSFLHVYIFCLASLCSPGYLRTHYVIRLALDV